MYPDKVTLKTAARRTTDVFVLMAAWVKQKRAKRPQTTTKPSLTPVRQNVFAQVNKKRALVCCCLFLLVFDGCCLFLLGVFGLGNFTKELSITDCAQGRILLQWGMGDCLGLFAVYSLMPVTTCSCGIQGDIAVCFFFGGAVRA